MQFQTQENTDEMFSHFENVNMLASSNKVPVQRPITTEITFCNEELECGHRCRGCNNEAALTKGKHMRCLEPECVERSQENLPTYADTCLICHMGALGDQPCIQIKCGHVFHADCVRNLVHHRWSTQRVTFNFMQCPTCKEDIGGVEAIPDLRMEILRVTALRRHVQKEAYNELRKDGLHESQRISNPRDKFYKRPYEYALHMTEFYECKRCQGPFFGGFVDCANEERLPEQTPLDPGVDQHLMCQPCRLQELGLYQKFYCARHGTSNIQYKCDFCCAPASFRCRTNTYYCSACHENPQRTNKVNCQGNSWKCPLLKGYHHPTARSIPIAGCIICTSQFDRVYEAPPETFEQKGCRETEMRAQTIIKTKRSSREACEASINMHNFLNGTRNSPVDPPIKGRTVF